MRTKIDCCRDCKNRHAGCHGDCPDYARENAELEEYRAKIRAKKDADAMVAEHIQAYRKKRHIKPKLPKEGAKR